MSDRGNAETKRMESNNKVDTNADMAKEARQMGDGARMNEDGGSTSVM